MEELSGFYQHSLNHRPTCLGGDAQCSICMKLVAHRDWWVLGDEALNSGAIVCGEDAEIYTGYIPAAVRMIEGRWAAARR